MIFFSNKNKKLIEFNKTMPNQKGKGGKNKKKGKNDSDDKRELVFKEDGQDYAVVEKMLGNGWLACVCSDGEKRNAHIRGAFRKKVWIGVGDVLLLSLRDFKTQRLMSSSNTTLMKLDYSNLMVNYQTLSKLLKINKVKNKMMISM